ncbi:MAG: hypothetical protein ABEJ65_09315 [bacterium]
MGQIDEMRFVLRLLVVKVEQVLVTNFDELLRDRFEGDVQVDANTVFKKWHQQNSMDEHQLRDELSKVGGSQQLNIDKSLVELMDWACNHTPVRVAIMSSGSREWVRSIVNTHELDSCIDLAYHYDRYPHGERRTLLQFLMNRFIAGKGRTMFIGTSLEDERLAQQEETRFRSLSERPTNNDDSGCWDYTVDELKEEIDRLKPET